MANDMLWLLPPLLLIIIAIIWWTRRAGGSSAGVAQPQNQTSRSDVLERTAAIDPVVAPAAPPEAAPAPAQAPEQKPDPKPKPKAAQKPISITPAPDAPTVETPKARPAAASITAIGIPAASGEPQDLLLLKGIGPKLNALLGTLGITRFDQIAAWSEADIGKVDPHLGAFKGRIVRDSWVEQAGLLASGQIAEFEARFGKIDGPPR